VSRIPATRLKVIRPEIDFGIVPFAQVLLRGCGKAYLGEMSLKLSGMVNNGRTLVF
jgi:hypothetical protein